MSTLDFSDKNARDAVWNALQRNEGELQKTLELYQHYIQTNDAAKPKRFKQLVKRMASCKPNGLMVTLL